MKVHQLIQLVDSHFPLSNALEWDNCGLQVGDPNAEVGKVLVCLDIGMETLEEAKEEGCNTVVSHHPLIFRGLKSIDTSTSTGSIIKEAIKNGINILSFHTNVDASEGGLAWFVANLLGLEVEGPLTEEGVGVIARARTTVEELLHRVQERLNPSTLRITKGATDKVDRVAVCPGSGGDLIKAAISKGAQCYITGDVKYHQAREAEGLIWVIDAGHHATELPFIGLMKQTLEAEGLEVVPSSKDRDPLIPFKGGGDG